MQDEVDMIAAQTIALRLLELLAKEPDTRASFEGLAMVFGDVCHQLGINAKGVKVLAGRALKASQEKNKIRLARAAKRATLPTKETHENSPTEQDSGSNDEGSSGPAHTA